MVVHALQCTDCKKTRVGRDRDNGITPVVEACPECGSMSYMPLSAKRKD